MTHPLFPPEKEAQRTEEVIRFCLRQERGGRTGPYGVVCTGAFDPYHLRSGKSDYQPIIDKILTDNKKFGIEPA